MAAALAVAIFGMSAAVAGPREDGEDAYHKGDFATAFRLWRPLAQKGDIRSQNHLGVMYYHGYGVSQDYFLAAQWFRAAADLGDGTSQIDLGNMYELGAGVSQSNALAHMWHSISVGTGHPVAHIFRDRIAAKTTQTQLAGSQRWVREWKPVGSKGRAE